MLKVKVCGITNLSDAKLCESAGADALGFIFFNKSRRYIEPDSAKEIIKQLSPFSLKVGVFVNESPDFINDASKYLNLNAVQLHGEEPPEVSLKINFPVIKSFRIRDNFNFNVLEKYSNTSFLLDTYSNSGYGGTGKTFNWEIIPKEFKSKIILAGGISVNNIEEIIKTINPAAVDISSSLEEEPGKKDEKKVREFFNKLNYLRRSNGYNDEAQCS